MINKAWEMRAHAHARTHTRAGVTPSIIETINTMPRSISHPWLSSSTPPPPIKGTRVWQKVQGALASTGVITHAHLQNICALQKQHAYCFFVFFSWLFFFINLTWQLTSLRISRKHSQLCDKMHDNIFFFFLNVQEVEEKCLHIWIFDLFAERRRFLQHSDGMNSTAGSQRSAPSNYLLPSGAINNGRQSASLRRGKCSHL